MLLLNSFLQKSQRLLHSASYVQVRIAILLRIGRFAMSAVAHLEE
jgi:hypothetical protein